MLNTNETVLTSRLKLNANKRAVVDSPLHSSNVNELCLILFFTSCIVYVCVCEKCLCYLFFKIKFVSPKNRWFQKPTDAFLTAVVRCAFACNSVELL